MPHLFQRVVGHFSQTLADTLLLCNPKMNKLLLKQELLLAFQVVMKQQ
jgi:hypothetical protein